MVQRPTAAGLLLAGPAGVGKSRLAAECAALADRAGFRTVRTLATRAASRIPLGALVPFLPARAPAWGSGDTLRILADVIAGDGGPLLMLVDDAHLLDEASALVVQQLAMTNRCFVVLTTRVGEAAPEPVVCLWKDRIVERLDVEPLTRTDVDQLLGAVLTGSIDGACRRDLWDASQGNTLLLRELVQGARESGILACTNGLWRLTRKLSAIPRLNDLIDARLVELAPAEREMMELLALGEPVALEVLAQAGDLEVIDRLERRGLAEVTGTGPRRVRLGHPLHGEVLRERISALGRMVISRRLADAAEANGLDRPDDVLRAVIWRLDSGGRVGPELMLQAARQAYFARDLRLTERLARTALSAGAGVAAGLVLAQVLGELGQQDTRHTLLCRLEHEATDDEQLATVVMHRADTAFWGLGRLAEADQDLATAAHRLPPGAWRDGLIAQRAEVAVLRGRPAEAITLAEPILELPSHGRAVVKAALAAATALAITGRCDRARVVCEQGAAAQLRLGEQEVVSDPAIHTMVRALILGVTGDLAQAQALLATGYDAALARGSRLGQAWCAWRQGELALLTGNLVAAGESFTEGAMVLAELALPGYQRWCLAGRVLALAQQHEPVATGPAIADLAAARPGPASLFESEVLRAHAWHSAARGDLVAARVGLRDAANHAAAMGASALEVSAWHDLVRLGVATESTAPLARLAEIIDGDFVQARAVHAAGVAHHDTALLVSAADRFETLGATLFAAEAAAAAAAGYRRDQQNRLANGLATRAYALAAQCPGAATPALRLAGPAAVLTPREWEVATLAAQGLTSKAIAERFTVSARTIDTHLQRIYTKLGITTRAELDVRLTLGRSAL